MLKPTFPALALAGALSLTHAVAAEPSQAQLQAQARIGQDQAERTALALVPNGKVHSSELEREHGKLVWSFDISQDGSRDMTEVQVDALTGKVVSKKKESAAQEAAEAAKEARGK
ncbi:PepSY domain-containing protein [Ramlibacter sp. G-1-2-2]|uniref:PepSY domain-containing protein n=1 Tax=Ramlibacter agri TaxID=2728837 RepID=A0A848GXW5_9BURK|nr:PepSY domain-containing protein [Ramlibacter agri]NML43194.1 PepSY domain-containing protein [Ramlibacter agri]